MAVDIIAGNSARHLTSAHAGEAPSLALQDVALRRPGSVERLSTSSSGSNYSWRSKNIGHTVSGSSDAQMPLSCHEGANGSSPQSSSAPLSMLTGSHSSSSGNPSGHGSPRSEREINIASATLARSSKPAPIPPSRPMQRFPERARTGSPRTPQKSYLGPSRPQTPMTFSDLGRDYSRYPFPSRRSSFSVPSTPAPAYSGLNTPTASKICILADLTNEKPLDRVSQAGYRRNDEKRQSWLMNDRLAAISFGGDAGYHFPLYIDEKETDDAMHNPDPEDYKRAKPKIRDCFSRSQLGSLLGLLFLVVGLFTIFILLPILSYTGHAVYTYPYDTPRPDSTKSTREFYVNDIHYPLLKNIRTSLIDPDTPESAMTRESYEGGNLQLVFSDEFQRPNRTFYPGDDPYWTAPDIWYGATRDLEWYDPDAVTTANGTLDLRLDQFVQHDVAYRSGMLNSWNQVCMKGGLLEVSVSLPGPGGASGLWPGVWAMGNLGRPGYEASTEGLWPYTYSSCDVGITPNQSMSDGTSFLNGQRLPSCTCAGEDHPTPGTGRGAPEIDVLEASADATLKLGIITQSYQVAPYDLWYQPNYDFFAIPDYNSTQMNGYCGGPFQQAVSAQTLLNNKWYDGIEYQKYGFEYTPGTLSEGKIAWFVGEDMTFQINGNAVGPNGNIDARPISMEPMSMVLNLGFSSAWTGIILEQLKFPTTMRVDYVRWYQDPDAISVTCDPPGFETTDYIKSHPNAYHNQNLTTWDETGYEWPKHHLNSNC